MKHLPISDDEIKAAIENGACFTKGAPAAARAPDVYILPPMTGKVKNTEAQFVEELARRRAWAPRMAESEVLEHGTDEFLEGLAWRISSPGMPAGNWALREAERVVRDARKWENLGSGSRQRRRLPTEME